MTIHEGDIIKFCGYDWRVLEVDTKNCIMLLISDRIIFKSVL